MDKPKKMGEIKVGVECGKCGNGSVIFITCPTHYWVISSICSVCGNYYKVQDQCPDCNFPFNIRRK